MISFFKSRHAIQKFDRLNPEMAKLFHAISDKAMQTMHGMSSLEASSQPNIIQQLQHDFEKTATALKDSDPVEVMDRILSQCSDNLAAAGRKMALENPGADKRSLRVVGGLAVTTATIRRIVFAWAPAIAQSGGKRVSDLTLLMSYQLSERLRKIDATVEAKEFLDAAADQASYLEKYKTIK